MLIVAAICKSRWSGDHECPSSNYNIRIRREQTLD
jgi:hypothetical protein